MTIPSGAQKFHYTRSYGVLWKFFRHLLKHCALAHLHLIGLLQSKRVVMKGTKMKHLHKTSSQLFERFGEVLS